MEKGEKIAKLLASCGHGSRRSCEELIDMLRVTINGKVAERGDRVLPGDDVRLDNSKLRPPDLVYYKLNKPKGYLCNDTPQKKTQHVNDLIPKSKTRLYAVGRLDKDFEGLLLFTNDGELCNRITHPRYQCPKKYEVKINGRVTDVDLAKIAKGIFLSEGKTAPIDIKIKKKSGERTIAVLEIRENRRRLIPRVFAHLDYHVEKVKRISVGPIKLSGLPVGEFRKLTPEEIETLKKEAFKTPGKTVIKKKNSRFNPNIKDTKKNNKTKQTYKKYSKKRN